MTGLDGWQPDPLGRHQYRHYVDGEPTSWVSDGNAVIEDPMATLDMAPVAYREPEAVETFPDATAMVPRVMPADWQPAVAPAGWYPNPTNPEETKYWDGSHWSNGRGTAVPVPVTSSQVISVEDTLTNTQSSRRWLKPAIIGTTAALAIVVLALVLGSSGKKNQLTAASQSTTVSTPPTTEPSVVTTAPPSATTPSTSPVVTSPATTPLAAASPSPTYAIPSPPTTVETPAQAVQAWEWKNIGYLETLDNDGSNINTADQEAEQSIGQGSAVNDGPLVAAVQQLASDVATAQSLPPVPDSAAESYWSADLSDLANGAADYKKAIADLEGGDTADGAALNQQGDTETEQAQIQQNDLQSRLSVAESG